MMYRCGLALVAVVFLLGCQKQKTLDGVWNLRETKGAEPSEASFKIAGNKYVPQGDNLVEGCEYDFLKTGSEFMISTPAQLVNRCAKIDRKWLLEQPNEDQLVLKKGDTRHTYQRLNIGGANAAVAGLTGDELRNYFTEGKAMKVVLPINSLRHYDARYFVNGQLTDSYPSSTPWCSLSNNYSSGSHRYGSYLDIPAGATFTILSQHRDSYYPNEYRVEFSVNISGSPRLRLHCKGSGKEITGAEIVQSMGEYLPR